LEWSRDRHFAPLAGASIVMPERSVDRDPKHWVELMIRHNVSVWHSVPALLELLVDASATLPGAQLLKAEVLATVLLCSTGGLALAVLPAVWTVDRRVLIALRVVASWLIAVALLGAILQFIPVTPGYMPDHME